MDLHVSYHIIIQYFDLVWYFSFRAVEKGIVVSGDKNFAKFLSPLTTIPFSTAHLSLA
jgi:hypothetical protein